MCSVVFMVGFIWVWVKVGVGVGVLGRILGWLFCIGLVLGWLGISCGFFGVVIYVILNL